MSTAYLNFEVLNLKIVRQLIALHFLSYANLFDAPTTTSTYSTCPNPITPNLNSLELVDMLLIVSRMCKVDHQS